MNFKISSRSYDLMYGILFSCILIIILSFIPNRKDDYRPQIGVCTALSDAEMLSGHGYDFIEESVGNFLMPLKSEEEFNKKLQLAQHSPIPVKACNLFIPGNLKSVGPEAVHHEILEFAETAFRRAQLAGIEVIVYGSGGSRRIPEGFDPELARNQFITLGKAMAPIAARYNIIIALEPLNSREVNFINSLAEGASIVEEINHLNFRLMADIYHIMMGNENPEDIIKYGHLIKHVHVAELEGRGIPGTRGEDLTVYFNALKEAGYEGRISIEGRWENMEAQAAKAFETLQTQL